MGGGEGGYDRRGVTRNRVTRRRGNERERRLWVFIDYCTTCSLPCEDRLNDDSCPHISILGPYSDPSPCPCSSPCPRVISTIQNDSVG